MWLLRWLADYWECLRPASSVPPPPFHASKRTAVIMYGVWYGRLTPEEARQRAAGWGFPPEAIEEMLAQATQPPSYWGRQQQRASEDEPGAPPARSPD
jgi:hypothetical protein